MTKPLLRPTLMAGRDRATRRALALGTFAGVRLPGHEAVVMTTYTAAQALLAERSPSKESQQHAVGRVDGDTDRFTRI